MNVKQLCKLLPILLLFLGVYGSKAANGLDASVEAKTMALTDFLTDLSEKHKVFFTYNPGLLSGTNLNPKEYRYNALGKIINKLEKKTSFDFEYLGNKYYVVYHKKPAKVALDKVSVFSNLDYVMSNSIFDLQQAISGKVTDENGDPLPGASIVVKGTTTGATTDFDG
ncbi:MAG: carboxypeptidase-like regulatory domain-containing protein, partial [Bacteroidota bacterium]